MFPSPPPLHSTLFLLLYKLGRAKLSLEIVRPTHVQATTSVLFSKFKYRNSLTNTLAKVRGVYKVCETNDVITFYFYVTEKQGTQ